MRRVLASALLTAGLLVAGCTTSTSGSAGSTGSTAPPTSAAPVAAASTSAVRHVDPNHITSADALGDIRTVSPCSLVDVKALSYGSTELLPADDIDDCLLSVRRLAGGPAIAIVGTLEDLSKAPAKGQTLARAGGLRIVRTEDGPTRCEEILVFADDVGMEATVTASGGTNRALCELATKLLDQVIATVTGPGPKHRDYPAYSLSGMKACELLTAAEVKLAGVGALHPLVTFPAQHRCLYGKTRGTADPQVELAFGERGPGLWDPKWTEVQLSAHDSLVIPDPEPGANLQTFCTVSMEWLLLDDDSGPKGLNEAAVLTVRVPTGGSAPCAQAKKVAAAVWKKLP